MIPALATTLCGALFVASLATFAGAVVLVRRARAADARAGAKYAEALEQHEAAVRTRDEAIAARVEAERIHAECRPRPFSVVAAPLGTFPLGLFGPHRGGQS